MPVTQIPPVLSQRLITEAKRINSTEFIDSDPVQFPRMFSDPRDIEIAALLAATIAWGNRKMICRSGARMFDLMEGSPWRYVMEGEFEELDDTRNIHRTFFARNLKHYLRGLRQIYSRHGSLEAFAAASGASESEAPAWTLVEAMNRQLREANGGVDDSRCLPLNLKSTALKRINMALRWLVRDDGIVDLGIWKAIKPAQLFIPMDVHVGNTARAFGLLERASNDRKAVEELTALMRTIRPDDPVLFDYALFGLGMGL